MIAPSQVNARYEERRECFECGTAHNTILVGLGGAKYRLSIEAARRLVEYVSDVLRYAPAAPAAPPADFAPLMRAMREEQAASDASVAIQWFFFCLSVLSGQSPFPGYRRQRTEPLCDGEWANLREALGGRS